MANQCKVPEYVAKQVTRVIDLDQYQPAIETMIESAMAAEREAIIDYLKKRGYYKALEGIDTGKHWEK